MQSSNIGRREFLASTAVAALGLATCVSPALAQILGERRSRPRIQTGGGRRNQAAKKRVPIALQLYSIREVANKDLAGTLKAVKEMGYDGVEFAGYYGHDPKEIRKMLDDNGLKVAGTHTGMDQFSDEKFEKTVELHQTLGAKFMIIPAYGGYEKSAEACIKFANRLNELAKKAEAVGMYIGYHAHEGDVKKIGDTPAWEMLFDATDKNVVAQMDIAHYINGGGDPFVAMEKIKGRTKVIHLTETDREIIGRGKVDWKRVFEFCETDGGTEWYIVEDEVTPNNLDRVAACMTALKEMGK